MFEASRVNRGAFANPRNHRAALWLGEKCNELLRLKDRGYIFLYENCRINLAFKFNYDAENILFGLALNDHCTDILVGDQYSEVDGKVWCTKKELTEILKRFTMVHPKNLMKVV